MSFMLFGAAVLVFFLLHLWPARRAWRRLRGHDAKEVDLSYVRLEDFFGRSFRGKLVRWRQLPPSGEPNPHYRMIWKGDEALLVAGTAHFPEAASMEDILALDGDFSCGARCTFTRELYVQRHCQIGKRTRLQSIATGGDLTLGPDSVVVRWVDATGDVELRPGARVLSRVTSEQAIRLNLDARALSLCAPEISSHRRSDESVEIWAPLRPGVGVTLLRPDVQADPRLDAGFERSNLIPLGEDGWMYLGDLSLSLPLRLQAKLVVRGSLTCPAGSYFEDDIKATGSIHLGARSIVRGNLVADRDLHLGERSFFSGTLTAGRNLRLGHTIRGIADPEPVVVYAGHILRVESNVVVQGKLAAREYVVAVDQPSAA